jgi:hypothetical protein
MNAMGGTKANVDTSLKVKVSALIVGLALTTPLLASEVTWEISGEIIGTGTAAAPALFPDAIVGDPFRVLVTFDTNATLIRVDDQPEIFGPGARYRYDASSLRYRISVGASAPLEFEYQAGAFPEAGGFIDLFDDTAFASVEGLPRDGISFDLRYDGAALIINLLMRGNLTDIFDGPGLPSEPDPRLLDQEQRIFQVLDSRGESIASLIGVINSAEVAESSETLEAEISVPGTASIYQVFGNPGSVDDSASDAPRCNFTAGSSNLFRISAEGGVNCCGSVEFLGTADGGNFFGLDTNITGINGLSDAVGSLGLGLLGVFTSETNPAGLEPPPPLPWDASAPRSLSPQLNQVFYVGDGRAGLDDPEGAMLTFTAPPSATRLYLGLADANFFEGDPSFYFDNVGSIQSKVYSNVSCATAEQLIDEMSQKVEGAGPPSLGNKLDNVLVYYEVGDIDAAGAEIEGFEGQVRGLKGLRQNNLNRLDPQLADDLLDDAAQLKKYIDYE